MTTDGQPRKPYPEGNHYCRYAFTKRSGPPVNCRGSALSPDAVERGSGWIGDIALSVVERPSPTPDPSNWMRKRRTTTSASPPTNANGNPPATRRGAGNMRSISPGGHPDEPGRRDHGICNRFEHKP